MHLTVPDASSGRSAVLEDVREHYDSLSPLYRSFWGEHIHHGYWRGNESAAEAQINLVDELASRARISGGESILDIGCGLGGSALYLAKTYGARVKGISISPKQIELARVEATRRSLTSLVRFEVQDAHRLSDDQQTYDVIWIIECSEHLFDKPAFIRECASHLNVGGRLAVCAWLRSEDLSPAQSTTVEAVQTGMLCPSFGTLADYSDWMTSAGLSLTSADDVTAQVERTWSLCRPVLKYPLVKTMLAVGSRKLRAFADSFEAIDEAYRTRAMRYGMFVAEKPAAEIAGRNGR